MHDINVAGFKTPCNHQECVSLLKDVTNNEYEIISKFSMMNGRTKFQHKKCGNEFIQTPYRFFIKGLGCPKCNDIIYIGDNIYKNSSSLQKEHADFTKKLFNKYKTEYIALEYYQGDNKPINIIHTTCKTIIKRTPKTMLNGTPRCPVCNPQENWTLKKVKTKIKKITENEFEIVSEKYKGYYEPIRIKHNTCGKTFVDTFGNFLETPKCKVCESGISIGEKRINKFLAKNNIQSKREFSIKGCRLKNNLSFDFAIFNNDKLKCLIEYDGEQHYYPVFGEDSFIQCLKSETIKNNFCEENNIKLIRIPFWESDNLEKILKSEMEKLKVM